MAPLSLRDAHDRVLIGQPTDSYEQTLIGVGATSILHALDGSRLGVYVDNETPNRDAIAAKLVGMIPKEQIVVGLYPKEVGHRVKGCICALEWYPFHQGWATYPPLGEQGYILQWNYAWPKDHPPSPIEASGLLQKVAEWKPEVLWVY
jgi:hypothetical protein